MQSPGRAAFTAEEVSLLLAATDGRDGVLFRMAVETGMRQGKLLALRWGAIE